MCLSCLQWIHLRCAKLTYEESLTAAKTFKCSECTQNEEVKLDSAQDLVELDTVAECDEIAEVAKLVDFDEEIDNTPISSIEDQTLDTSVNEEQPIRRKRKRSVPCHKKKLVADRHEAEDDAFLFLHDAIADGLEEPEIEELDLVLIPPENVDGETDNELGNDEELSCSSLNQVQEVCGRIELQTSRDVTRVRRKKVKVGGTKNYKRAVKKAVEKVKDLKDQDIDFDTKINNLVESAEVLDEHRIWKETKEKHEGSGLKWKKEMSDMNKENLTRVHDIAGGKLPVKIFELMFNDEIREHIIQQTITYVCPFCPLRFVV